ncbi:MAG TPA: amidophosphoribosyltransferase [Alloiococcus sp.]|nr:amidophosphoribosyltransferase [Alloiococcus sp.]
MFAIWDYPEAAKLSYFALLNLQHRGQQGVGITVFDQATRRWGMNKGKGLINDVFNDASSIDFLTGNCALSSVHYSPANAINGINDINPLKYVFQDESVSIAFEGHITNSQSLRQTLEDQGTVFHSKSDTELFIHLIRQSKQPTMIEKIKEITGDLQGGYSVVILTEEGLYAFVDKNGFRPLVIGRLDQSESYMISSESCVFQSIGATIQKEVRAGEIVKISDNGLESTCFAESETMIEAMEYVYFARPDTTMGGVNIYQARRALGRKLADEDEDTQADLVMGVPNSSLIAAMGYADSRQLRYDLGLVKNQYIGRTFIQPTQELRELGVKNKLSVISESVKDKSIILIDDSIVRGTTSKQIVKLIKDAGAKEVHLRISSPPIIFPNYYGIDMSSSQELLAAKMTVEEMRDYIGCDSLKFLSIDALTEAVQEQNSEVHLSLSIFNGEYIDGIGDYKTSLASQLTPIQKSHLKGGKYVRRV